MSEISREAVDITKSYMVEGAAKESELQAALGHFSLDLTDALPQPSSDEAEELVNKIKPERYAHFARAMNELFDVTLGNVNSTPPPVQPGLERGAFWFAVEDETRAHLEAGLGAIEKNPAYVMADEISQLVAYLQPDKHRSAESQLNAGIFTAVDTNFRTLKMIPAIATEFGASLSASYSDIAKNSLALSYSLSKGSIDRLKATRNLIQQPIPQAVNFDVFKPIYKDGQLFAISYKDLGKQKVLPGFLKTNQNSTKENEITVDQVTSPNKTIIGCPLTLLKGRSRQLWDWMIDTVDAHDLWREAI